MLRKFITEQEEKKLKQCAADGIYEKAFKNWTTLTKQDDISENIILGLKNAGLKKYNEALKCFDEAAKQGDNISFILSIVFNQQSGLSRENILENIWLDLANFNDIKSLKSSLRIVTGEDKKILENFWESQRPIYKRYLN